jgi:hypothetical protein
MSMILENYDCVIKLYICTKFDDCNILFSLCLLVYESQFDVCLLVFVYSHCLTDNIDH